MGKSLTSISNTILIDTNILLRFLLQDHSQHFAYTKSLFHKAALGKIKIYLDEVIVAEAIWVLTTHYDTDKLEAAQKLTKFINQHWVKNPRKKVILKALLLYSSTNLSYVDCWVLTVSKHQKLKLETFDKALQKLT